MDNRYIMTKKGIEHRILAEKALGRPLPKYAIVHHINCIKSDNRPSNLVICPNDKYHKILHMRTKKLGLYQNAPKNLITVYLYPEIRRQLDHYISKKSIKRGKRLTINEVSHEALINFFENENINFSS